MPIKSFNDLFRRYNIHYSEDDSLDDRVESMKKLYFFLNEEVSLMNKDKIESMNNWKAQSEKGDGKGHHLSSVKNNK